MRIRNSEVEQLAEELSRLTHSSKTEVVRQALRENKDRLAHGGDALNARRLRLFHFLENRVWPRLPENTSDSWTAQQENRALGYGDHGKPG